MRRQLLLRQWFQKWIYLSTHTPPTHSPKLMLLPGNVSEWENQDAGYRWHSSLSIWHSQAWKNPRSSSTRGLGQILLPCPPRTTTNLQVPACATPIPPSTKLQTWGQMANSNVHFCASFQIALAQPDGILCLSGINLNLQVATALPRAINSTSFQAHWKVPWKTSLWK